MSATGADADEDEDTGLSGDEYGAARAELRAAVPEAAATVRELLDAEDDRVRLQAAKTVLDRGGLVPAERRPVTSARKRVGGESRGSGTDDLESLLRQNFK